MNYKVDNLLGMSPNYMVQYEKKVWKIKVYIFYKKKLIIIF